MSSFVPEYSLVAPLCTGKSLWLTDEDGGQGIKESDL